MKSAVLSVVAAGLMVAIVAGCIKVVPTGTVSGSVTYKGKPMTVGTVIFCSPDSVNRAGGEIDSEGKFTLTGPLPAGEYKVGFAQPFFDDPVAARPPELTSPLPAKYLAYETSGLTFTVKKGDNTADFNL
ncbi:MAG: hypothetical protein Q4G68_11650 [Planctomycetia bacterium]|nr:hypothetical protein [Planctomycetia bacterium]